MNDYQQQQWDALQQARDALLRLSHEERDGLTDEMGGYLQFRRRVDEFLETHFSTRCTQSCFENRRSACCGKDGIITFWADVLINALFASAEEIADLEQALTHPVYAYKCTYLGQKGCRWRVRPLGCVMFLCDDVRASVFGRGKDRIQSQWSALKEEAKAFRWPDKPVLFDRLETYFLERGSRSPLMYINTSPGLMRIKRLAGLPVI